MLASFVLGVLIFLRLIGEPSRGRPDPLRAGLHLDAVRSLDIGFGLLVDPLSITFVLLITGVGSLIHIYSIGYMSHDADRRKFFAYLNLFVAAMLLLVLGNSFVSLYAGWEASAWRPTC